MARTYFIDSGAIGADPQKIYDNQDDFSVGRCFGGTDDTKWTFASLNTAVSGGDFVAIDENHSAAPLTTALAQVGHTIGVVVTAASAGKLVFAATNGVVKARVAANASLDKKVFLSDVNGVVTSSAGSGISIQGAVLASAGGAATALKTVILRAPHHTLASA